MVVGLGNIVLLILTSNIPVNINKGKFSVNIKKVSKKGEIVSVSFRFLTIYSLKDKNYDFKESAV